MRVNLFATDREYLILRKEATATCTVKEVLTKLLYKNTHREIHIAHILPSY